MSHAREIIMRMTNEMETNSTEVRFSNLKASPPTLLVMLRFQPFQPLFLFSAASFAFLSIVARSSLKPSSIGVQ